MMLSMDLLKEQEWREGFEAMGHDPDVNDVEYMLPAAREVLFADAAQESDDEEVNFSRWKNRPSDEQTERRLFLRPKDDIN